VSGFFSWLSFAAYRLLMLLAVPLLLIFRPVSRGKFREFLQDRQTHAWLPLPGRTLWIHASSGEIEYAKPLIRALKTQWPQRPLLVTYFSPSAKKLMRNVSGVDAFVALPWDRPSFLQKFIRHFKPEALLIARTDVWPELAYQCKKNDIPAYLFSATFHRGSSRNRFFSQALTRFAFHQLTEIFCVSESDLKDIQALGVKVKISATGDTRYDQVAWRLAHPHQIKNELRPASRKNILVAGSTWPQDEKILLPGALDFLKNGGRLILAPHEVNEERILSIEKNLADLGLTWQRYSRSQAWRESVLLLDQIGCLQEIYLWGELAFVGGSFKSRVHSVMEPLAAGLPVILGPYFQNNREAIQFLNVKDTYCSAISIVHNQVEFSQTLKHLSEKGAGMSDIILKNVKAKTGATQTIVGVLEQTL
jgi:3-deoxy-D-manno-octulosonic-acid transferase